MNNQTKQTLKEIFIKHGLDPFDAFLLNEADMPEEAQRLLRADRESHDYRKESEERIARNRAATAYWDRWDRNQE